MKAISEGIKIMINIDDLQSRFEFDKEEFANTPNRDREDKAYLKGRIEVHRLYQNKLKNVVVLEVSEHARLLDKIAKLERRIQNGTGK